MNEAEIQRYKKLNELADKSGIVVFGGNEDLSIPLGEIRQAFSIESKMYNRSISALSVKDAIAIYKECVAPLSPDTVLVHLGDADKKLFSQNSAEFDSRYRALISHIKAQDKHCRVAVISLRNYEGDPLIEEINKHLRNIAESERCEYGDIANRKVWNPKSIMNAVSFVYSVGFMHPLKNKRPLYDLVRMLYCH